jgi:hypothetical protein
MHIGWNSTWKKLEIKKYEHMNESRCMDEINIMDGCDHHACG